jgi:acyl carrier protein
MSVENLPRSAIEERLSTYWRELFGIEAVRRDENFVEAGGDSIKATILANRIEDELGVRLSMEELYGTVEEQAIACEQLKGS